MRHSVLGPNALEKQGLIPLLSFQWQIPLGAYETGLFSCPNTTHLSLSFSPSLSSFSLSVRPLCLYISIRVYAAQSLLHAVSWQD